MQGVGFRPYVHRLAGELQLGGFVLNDERGVLLEVEGDAAAVASFLARLPAEAPPLATVERVHSEALEPAGDADFAIVASARGGEPLALVSPDSATCDDCLAEMFDPADRRHRYPFINCTNCGPRFTIVRGVPYDRPLTTMAAFVDVRPLPRRVRRPVRPPLPRPAQRLPRVRPDRGLRRGGRRGRAGRRGRCPARRARGGGEGRGRLSPRLPGRRRGRGCRPARAQAPRGQAVRADGAGPRYGAGARRARPRRGGAAAGPRAADRARAAAPRRARGTGRRAALGRPRGDAALLAAAPPAAYRRGRRARDDQRQRLRRADRLHRRRRAAAAGGNRRRLSDPRPADPHAHRRLGRARPPLRRAAAAAPLAGPCPGQHGPPAARPAARGVRRRAQGDLLRGEGHAGLGRPPHRRPAEPRDADLVPRGHRALRGALRRRPRGGRPRPASGLPLDGLRAAARRRRARGRPAPPCAPRCLPGRARRDRAGDRRDLRRHRPGHRRHDLGRRAAGRRPGGLRARRASAPGTASGRRPGGARAMADGVLVAGRGGGRAAAASFDPRRRRRPDGVDGRRQDGAHGLRGAGDDQHGAALRCGRRAGRRARPRQLRGAGRGRARGSRGARGRPAGLSAAGRPRPAGRARRAAGHHRGRRRRARGHGGRDGGRALPRRGRGGHRAGLRDPRRAPRPRDGRAVRRRVPEPAAA